MIIRGTEILDTYAEAFNAWYVRFEISALDSYWLDAGLNELCGYGTSVIGCDCEIGVESRSDTKANVMAFAFKSVDLEVAIQNRFGQAFLTCPTLGCKDSLSSAEKSIAIGDHLRFFGDGHEVEDSANALWQIPVMEGTIELPKTLGIARGLAGGNLILQGKDQEATLRAARRAVEAIAKLPGVITPFPGGVCRSGSKVGSKYKNLIASTNQKFCPGLKPEIATELVPDAKVVYEIIINGQDEVSVRKAMHKAVHCAAGEELLAISAGNYGGKLGKTCLGLHDLL